MAHIANNLLAKECEIRFQNGDQRHQVVRPDGAFKRSAPSMRQALLLADEEDVVVSRQKPKGYSTYQWVVASPKKTRPAEPAAGAAAIAKVTESTAQHTPTSVSAQTLLGLADEWDTCCNSIDSVMTDAQSIGESKAMRTCARELRTLAAKATGSAA